MRGDDAEWLDNLGFTDPAAGAVGRGHAAVLWWTRRDRSSASLSGRPSDRYAATATTRRHCRALSTNTTTTLTIIIAMSAASR